MSSSSIRTRLLVAGAFLSVAAAGTSVAQTATPADPAPSAQAAPQTVPRGPGPGMQPGQGMPGPHGGLSGHHDYADRGERMFLQFDTDHDGKLSRSEFEAGQKAMMERAQRAFDIADVDRDGSLSVSERQAFRRTMHAQIHAQAGVRDGSPRRRGGAVAPAAPPVQPGS